LNALRGLIKQTLKSEFFRNVVTLFSGTALAQLIPFIITPILTRIYTPSDYGVLALFVASTSLFAVVATLRYEAAILLPADDDDALALTILCGLCVICIAVLLALITLLFHNILPSILNNPAVTTWLYFVPLSVALIGCASAFNYWLNRHKQYRKLAVNRIIVAFVTAIANLAFGLTGFGYAGLISAVIIGQLVSLFMLLAWTWRDLRGGFSQLGRAALTHAAKSYRKFPIYSLPSDVVNMLAQQLPVLMLSRFFGATVVGHFSFSQKILGLPINLLSQSISDVFRQRASMDYVKIGNCSAIFNKTSKVLSLVSIIPLIVIFAFAPVIFRILFGDAWVQAGEYTRYLAPLYIFRFIVRPLSYVFYIANRQDADLAGQIGLLFLTVASMIAGAYMKNSDTAIIAFSAGYILVYCFYFWGARNLSNGKPSVIFNRAT